MKKLYLVLVFSILFLFVNKNSYSQWAAQNYGVNNLASISFVSQTVGFVVDFWPKLYMTTNGGLNWNYIADVPINTRKIWFTSASTGYALGDNAYAGILKTTDGGYTWTGQILQGWNFQYGSGYIRFFNQTDGVIGYVNDTLTVGYSVIYKTTDAGATWQNVNSVVTGLRSRFCFLDVNTGFESNDSTIFKTTDAGVTWNPIYTVPAGGHRIFHINFPNLTLGYMTDELGYGFATHDGGVTWNMNLLPGSPFIQDSWFPTPGSGFLIGGTGGNVGVIISTSDSGNTWQNLTAPIHTLYSVMFPTANVGYTCGDGGEIWKYSLPVGIHENHRENGTNIFPNPATNTITISTKEEQTNEIIDVLGQKIVSIKTNPSENITIDISSYPNIFFIKTPNGVKKIIRVN